MHLRFSFNSNNLNAQVNKLHNLKYWDYAPGLAFGGVLSDFGFTFRCSLSSVKFIYASGCSFTSLGTNSCVPSANNVASICNAIVGFSEVLKYSFPSLKDCYPIK